MRFSAHAEHQGPSKEAPPSDAWGDIAANASSSSTPPSHQPQTDLDNWGTATTPQSYNELDTWGISDDDVAFAKKPSSKTSSSKKKKPTISLEPVDLEDIWAEDLDTDFC